MHARLVLLVVCAALTLPAAALAHVPHDRVTHVRIVDDGAGGHHTFAIVRSRLYRSIDGMNFERLQRGMTCDDYLPSLGVAADPAGTRVVVACGRQLYTSTDAGSTLTEGALIEGMFPRAMRLSPTFTTDGMILLDGPGAMFGVSRDGGQSVKAIWVQGGATAIGWAGGQPLIGTAKGLLATLDAENKVVRLADVRRQGAVTALVDVGDGAVVIGTSRGRVARVDLGTGNKTHLSTIDGPVIALAATRDAKGPLLGAITDERGVFLSRDGGVSWVHHRRGIARSDQSTAYEQATFYDLSLAATGEVWVATFTGLYRATLSALEDPSVPPEDSRFVGQLLSYGHIVGLSLIATPGGPLTAWLSLYGSGLHSVVIGDEGVGAPVIGHPDLTITRLGTSVSRGQVLVTSSYGRVTVSTDGGASLNTLMLRPVPGSSHALKRRILTGADRHMPSLARGLRRVLLDTSAAEIEGTPLSAAISPAFDDDGVLLVGISPYGLLRSTDGGASFSMVWDGEGETPRSLALSPRFADNGVVWLGTKQGVFRSHARGRRPERCFDGTPSRRPLLAFADDGAQGIVFLGAQDGLWVTADRCNDWRPLDVGDGKLPVAAVAVSPAFADDRTFFMQTVGATLKRCELRGTKASCVDLGHSFLLSPVAQRDGNVLLALSPRYAEDGVVVAVDEATVHVSRDRGATFEAVTLDRRFEAEMVKVDWLFQPIRTEGEWYADGMQRITGTIVSAHRGAKLTADVVGRGLRILGDRNLNGGRAHVWHNGEVVATVDTYAPHEERGAVLWSWSGDAPIRHRVVIEVLGESDRRSRGTRVSIDAIDVVR